MFWIRLKNTFKSIFQRLINKTKNSPFYWRSLIVVLFIAIIIKWFIIYFSYKNLNPRESCISHIYSDIAILFFAQLLITINSRIKKRPIRLIINIIVIAIILAYFIDIFTIYFFQSRVSIVEALSLWSSWSLWFAHSAKLRICLFLAIWILSFIIVQACTSNKKSAPRNLTIFFCLCCIFYTLFYIWIFAFNINVQRMENIFTINLQTFKKPTDSISDTNYKPLSYEDYIFNVQWEWKDLNVILVFAESLSAIDSANMWWNNNIPYFDKIQNDWIKFSNFITNWTTSDTAHISTLYWVIPLINMWENNTPYSWYKLSMQPLPEYLNTQWYKTTFVSAASLKFLDQRTFLSWAWFQKIIWEEAFSGSEKYTFDAAPDEELYDKVLQEVQNQTWKYFIWLQTISFHKPYKTPLWETEALALQYSDEELFKFYESLKEIWFFDSWILIIVGDHRKMNPAEEWEYDKLWANRYTKSVATIVGSGIIPWSINNNIIQHTDFYNSLKILVWSWAVKIDKTYNDVFSDKTNRDRWITNSECYETNRYTVSSLTQEPFLFRNLSNLSIDNEDVYNYFSSYLKYEFWNTNIDSEENDDSIRLIWHRWDIENYPENTLESFLSAKEQWAIWIEFDVSYTQDKKNIVAHWNELYSSNCTRLKVWNYTFDWIKKNCTIKNWEKYKTLQEMLELVDGLFEYYFLEIKVYDEDLAEEQTLDAIQTVKDLNMQDRVIFISYSNTAREVLNSDPDIIYGWDTFEVNDLDFIWENNSKYFLAPYDILTPEIVQKAKDLWKEVVTYTVNETWDFQSMKDLWVNIIMTDKLDLLQNRESQIHWPIDHNLENLNLKKSSR